ncbi:MAG: carbon storage regulator CsrA [Nitrospirota bacterium]|nr:MAG: carbon storage regulator CsrA [Nitrospirota bacterium]
MLILTRRINEAIRLGEDTRIVLVQVKGGQVRIGIECPPHVRILREEVYQVGSQENLKPVSTSGEQIISLPNPQALSEKLSR